MNGGEYVYRMYAKIQEWIRNNHEPSDEEIDLVMDVDKIHFEFSGEEMPAWLFRLVNVKTLDMGRCSNVRRIPEEIRNFTNLIEFRLVENKYVTCLPDSIGDLTNLRFLVLGHVPIASLPASVSKLSKLMKVVMGATPIAEIPPALSGLTGIRALIFNECPNLQLKEGDFGNFTKLERLEMAGTPIQMLPESLCKCTVLKWLRVKDCDQLKTIPVGLSELPLDYLNLNNAALEHLDSNLLAKFPCKKMRFTKSQQKHECHGWFL